MTSRNVAASHDRSYLRVPWSRRSGGYRLVEVYADQVSSGCDLELGKDLTEVVVDRARAQEEPLRDARVGHPVRDETGDLQLSRRELVPFGGIALTCRLAARSEL